MKTGLKLAAAGVSTLALAGVVWAQNKPVAAGPVATYWMTAETTSGLGAAMGRGGAGMVGAMMSGRMSGGTAHTLRLQLGSNRRAQGSPSAEHLPPAGLGAGASLPLLTPDRVRPEPTGPMGPMERPKGKMLIFWGCGEKAGPGQPVVIDFAKLAAGQLPAGFNTINVRAQTPPSPGRDATYGEWPNQRSSVTVPATGSLVGEHVVRGNYSPEIRFSLAPGQDFLPPLSVSNGQAGSGAVLLNWRQVTGARAYLATAMGSSEDGTVVMWSSSATQMAGMGIPDFMSDGDLSRLVAQKVLMSPATTQCAVPAEAVRAMPQAMLQMIAYGPEANFSYPPRPAPLQWAVKLRTKSTYMTMLGMDMSAFGGAENGDDNAAARQQQQPQKKKKKGLFDSIGGIPFP